MIDEIFCCSQKSALPVAEELDEEEEDEDIDFDDDDFEGISRPLFPSMTDTLFLGTKYIFILPKKFICKYNGKVHVSYVSWQMMKRRICLSIIWLKNLIPG